MAEAHPVAGNDTRIVDRTADVWTRALGWYGVTPMAKKRVDDELLFHDKVVAAVDLPGVPAGTPGKVTLSNGFRWKRYRVYFENGQDVGSLDRSQLALRSEWTDQYHRVAD